MYLHNHDENLSKHQQEHFPQNDTITIERNQRDRLRPKAPETGKCKSWKILATARHLDNVQVNQEITSCFIELESQEPILGNYMDRTSVSVGTGRARWSLPNGSFSTKDSRHQRKRIEKAISLPVRRSSTILENILHV